MLDSYHILALKIKTPSRGICFENANGVMLARMRGSGIGFRLVVNDVNVLRRSSLWKSVPGKPISPIG